MARFQIFLKWFFYTVFFIKLIDSVIPFSQVDALLAYIVFPKLIVQEGWKAMVDDLNYVYTLSGFFHHLYIIPALLFKGGIWMQGATQLMHFLCGLGLGSFIILKEIKDDTLKYLGALALLTMSESAEFFLYGKADGALAAVSLAAAVLVYKVKDEKLDQKNSLILGVIMGMMVFIKLSGLFTYLPMFIALTYFQFFKHKDIKPIFIVGIVSILVSSPLFIRNFFLTGTPFYPGLTNLFPGNLPQSTIDFSVNCYNITHTGIKSILEHFSRFFQGKILFWFFPIMVWFNFKQSRKYLNWIAFMAAGPFIIFFLKSKGIPYVRFIFPVFFINIFFLFKSLENTKLKPWMIGFIFALTLADSKIDKVIRRSVKFYSRVPSSTTKELVNYRIPYTKVWDFVEPGTSEKKVRVLADEQAQSFYAPPFVRVYHYPINKYASFLKECPRVNQVEDFDYAVISGRVNNQCTDFIKNNWQRLTNVGHHVLYKK